jgi:hypothetical protein
MTKRGRGVEMARITFDFDSLFEPGNDGDVMTPEAISSAKKAWLENAEGSPVFMNFNYGQVVGRIEKVEGNEVTTFIADEILENEGLGIVSQVKESHIGRFGERVIDEFNLLGVSMTPAHKKKEE